MPFRPGGLLLTVESRRAGRAFTRLAAALGAFLVAALALSACSGSDDCCDDLESYLRRFDEIEDRSRAEFEELNRDLDNSLANSTGLTASTRGEITNSFGRGEEILTDVIADLEKIDPPAEVADEHAELIAGYAEFRLSFATLRGRVPQIASTADLVAALAGQAEAGGRANAACDAMQELADANSIDVTFECGIENE